MIPLSKIFDTKKDLIFSAGDKKYVILNDSVEFQEVGMKVRYIPFGKVYSKTPDEMKERMIDGTITYFGRMDTTPDKFNFGIGLVFYSPVLDKYYVVIGGGIRKGEDTTRFVEAEKMLYGWKKLNTEYNVEDKILKEKQNANELWNVGVYDKELELF